MDSTTDIASMAMSEGDEFALGARLYDEERYEEAYEIFRRLAQNGDPTSCSFLGEMHFSGKGVPVNWAESIMWDLEARRLGSHVGTTNLALTCIQMGQYRLARHYLEEVCLVDDGDSKLELAKLLVQRFGDTASGLALLDEALHSENISEHSLEEARAFKLKLMRGGSRQ